ncbi:hypothetical protein [Micrococcus sp.]|uniref:hypothetical protein n=1 Tax=Micrococcus sp. TaxID=1271 RepID=UPI002A91686E|nr:hypothetical protein [Micrococcus sp.]MDY6055569.1 hypothetical protein [Micrococcus sp.]
MSAHARIEDTLPTPVRPGAVPSSTRQERTPLSVVPAPQASTWPRTVLLCLSLVLAALAAALVLNISMSNRQYELVDLRRQQAELSETNQRLAEQVGYLQAPQNLAARADALGMVTSGGTSTIDVATGAVTEAPAGGRSEQVSATFVAPPANADAVRQGVSGQDAAQGEIPAPRTSEPSAAPDRGADASRPARSGGSDR